MRMRTLVVAAALLMVSGCHPGPVINTGPQPAGGTIAGIVSTETKAPIAGRKVTAVNLETNARFDATTGVNGGYTIQVPQGTFRLEIELSPGETIVKQPSETRVNRSDLDPRRDFIIARHTGG